MPVEVAFPELNDDPRSYRDRLIRVTGSFTQLEKVGCAHWQGPQLTWALIGDELRLDAAGYERVVRYLPKDTPLTIDGFWRLYHGPVGCGKEPPVETVWYLDVLQVVQPNPLPLVSLPLTGAIGSAITGPEVTPTDGTVPPINTVPPVSPATTGTPSGTPTAVMTPTASGTPTATETAGASPTISGTPGTTVPPTPSPTVAGDGSGTPTVAATPTLEPTATSSNLPTATSGPPLPTFTPTSASYPGPTPPPYP